MFFARVPARLGKYVSLLVVAFAILLSPLNVDAQELIIQQTYDDHQARKEMQALLRSTQDLANTYGRFNRVDPLLMSSLNYQLMTLKAMPAEEMHTFRLIKPMVVDLRVHIEELNRQLSEHMDVVANQQDPNAWAVGIMGLTWECPTSTQSHYGSLLTGWLGQAPDGPCGQEGLSDAGYPFACRIATPPSIMIIARQVTALARAAANLAEKACYQSVFGGNLSTACAVTEAAFSVVFGIFATIEECNNKRGESEAYYTYVRAGEMFAKSRGNFTTQNTAMLSSFNDVGSAEDSLVGTVSDARTAMSGAMTDGFSGIEARLSLLETSAIQSSQALDRVLREQLEIMELLGIAYLHQTPSTIDSGATSYNTQATPAKTVLKPVIKTGIPANKHRGGTR
jgi:hypothetical protein